MKRSLSTLAIASITVLAASSAAHASLATWNVTPGGTTFNTGTYANWMPGGGTNPNNLAAVSTGTVSGINYSIWDGAGPHGLSSSTGGQQFDIKAMYTSEDSTYLHIGIITGFNPAGTSFGGTTYHIGDIDINPTGTTAAFGLMTPSAADGTSGSNLQLIAGGTWSTPNANHGFSGIPYSTLTSGGTVVASDDSYTYTSLGINYYDTVTSSYVGLSLLEYNIKLSELGTLPANGFTVDFGLSCENDTMAVTVAPHAGSPVPEPATLSVLGLAGAGLLLRRKR